MRTWDLIYAACDRRQTYPPSAAAGARSTGLAAAFAHEVKEGTPIHAHLTFEPAGDGTRLRFRAHGRLRGRAPRVLLVDDQPDFRHVVRLLLERRGYAVVAEAGCAATALDAVERFAPDAVLLDIRLGYDDGFDVCRRLTRARPELAVLLTSTGDYDQCDGLVASSGARGFIRKARLLDTDFGRFWPRAEP